jgi:hypothetical protein
MIVLLMPDEKRFVFVAPRVIAGTANKAERNELKALIAKNPDFQEEFRQLEADLKSELPNQVLKESADDRFFDLALMSFFRELRLSDRKEFEKLWKADPKAPRKYESLRKAVKSALESRPPQPPVSESMRERLSRSLIAEHRKRHCVRKPRPQ